MPRPKTAKKPKDDPVAMPVLPLDMVGHLDPDEPIRYHRVLDNQATNMSGKRRIQTIDDVAEEEIRVYRAVRRGKLSSLQGHRLMSMLKTIAATMAIARLPANVAYPTSRASPDQPATLPELAQLLADLAAESTARATAIVVPHGSVLPSALRDEAEGRGAPLADSPVPGSTSEP